jgi:putative Holliday junction resolvase
LSEGPGRVAALDVGEVRVGLAVSDPLGYTAQPTGFLPRRPQARFLSSMRSLLQERGVSRLVVGLPLLLSGERGARARDAEELAALLERELGVPVDLWDERLTTVQAERALREGASRARDRKGRVDAVAAAVLLQSYLDAGRSSST